MKKNLLGIVLPCLLSGALHAQTPSDAVMMDPRESCFALSYDHGSFDQYWEGTLLRKNETIATVSRNQITPMIAIGITNKFNFYIGVPYVKTESSEPNGGKFQGAKGFQDLMLAVKYQFLDMEMVAGKFSVFASGGYSTPVTNYLSDYRPYSLGNGTNEWSLRGIAQYKMEMGFYGRIAAGYLSRGLTKAERDYYYNNGSYYTAWMDVPSAVEYNVVAGIRVLDNSLKIEASYYGLKSTSGDDIRKYNAPQPTNKVEFGQVGGSLQYFIKPLTGVSLMASYSQTLSGRNAPKMTTFGGGITYQFKI